MRTWPALATASLTLLAGCAGAGPHHLLPRGDHFAAGTLTQSRDRSVAREAVYSVNWFKDLVEPEAFEWKPREFSRPVVDDSGRVFVATRDGYVRALDSDGAMLWEQKIKGPFSGGLAVENDKLIVPSADGVLWALSTLDGSVRWKYQAGEELGSRPVIANGTVYVMSFADSIYAVDAETGAWKWQYRRDVSAEFTIRGVATPTVDFDKIFVGFSDGSAMCLDAADGTVKWARQLSQAPQFPDVDADPQVDGQGHVLFASYASGLFSLDEETGAIVWASSVSGITNILLDGNTLYAGSSNSLSARAADTGKERWHRTLDDGYSGPATLVSKYLLVPTTRALLFLDRETGALHHAFDPGRGVSAPPAVSRNALFVLSNYGNLYALALNRPGKG